MRRSLKAAGFSELKDGRWFHAATGAYGRLLKRSFRICRASASIPEDRRHTIRRSKNRSCLSNLEEVWEVSPGDGMAKLLRKLVTDATPKIGEPKLTAYLIDRMSDRSKCGSNPAHINRGRGGTARTRPNLRSLLGWSPKSFRADTGAKVVGESFRGEKV